MPFDAEIKTAVRKATPALMGFWGPSGSGKTLSALKVARGLVGPEGKIGLIDTENRRALFYAKEAGGWDHLDFQPPFAPDRYTEALKKFENAGGYGCIIVDSQSHVWEGEGGVLEMADQGKTARGDPRQGLNKWQAPKMSYKRMLNNLPRAPVHVIFCLRAKDGVRQKGSGAAAEIESSGLEPICEKNFIYEMTVAVLLGPDHKPLSKPIDRFFCNPIIPVIKAPQDLLPAIKPGEFLSEATGQAIAEWVGGGAPVDQETEKLLRTGREIATLGNVELRKWWDNLDRPQQASVKPILDGLKQTATDADRETQESSREEAPPVDALDDSFTGEGPRYTEADHLGAG